MGPLGTGRSIEFTTTHWSVVLAATRADTSESVVALGSLCEAYWYPIYTYLRRHGHTPPDAEDLTQGFFARLLAKRDLGRVDPARGRFRGWLLGCLQNFLANEWDRSQALKRGGGCTFVPLEFRGAEHRYQAEAQTCEAPDRAFERDWAVALLDAVRRRLGDEYGRRGWQERFDLFERFLPGEESVLTQAEVGRQLGLSEGAVKGEVHRLKRRFGELLRQEIARTVSCEAEVDEELRALRAVLAGG